MGLLNQIKNSYREWTGTQTEFRRKLQVVIDARGLRVRTDEPTSVLMYMRSNGEERGIAAMCPDGRRVRLIVYGTFTFNWTDRHRLRQILDEANEMLEDQQFTFDFAMCANTTRFYVKTDLPLELLNLPTFESCLDRMVPMIQDLDTMFRS